MNVTVLGTGGWGLTLGQVLNDNGHKVSFWTFSQAEVDLLSTEHQYKDKLPGVIFPDSFTYTTDMNKALEGAELVLIVVPGDGQRLQELCQVESTGQNSDRRLCHEGHSRRYRPAHERSHPRKRSLA